MKLEMVKGRESSLIVESVARSIEEDGFLADSYAKALQALRDYVEQTDRIRQELTRETHPSSRNSILYRSPQNIIAFSGKRGSGKSSAMLSLSDMLGSANKWSGLCGCARLEREYSKLKSRRFVVIDPIDPTTLETNQSILSVILSRLLFMAESAWSQHIGFYGSFQDKESKKTELLTLARRCLNGIRSIKEKKEVARDLSDLQRVGDSSILKKNLYDFVELFLQFCDADTGGSGTNHMLVLQIDDTDCQISQGHETMEDIRKYLTIPNVLILMATDTKLLRQVLTQHYVSDFSDNLKFELVKVEEIRRLGEKHLAKLMPPPHVIHLPNIDEIIRDKTDILHVFYYETEEERPGIKHLLNPCGAKDYERYDFQSVILRYIYRKTHIVFTAHDAYANNIIPTTLRGLAYLLSQLSAMEDIPEIDLRHEPFSAAYLADALRAQFDILERNLNLVEEYFLHGWVPAKLPQKMADTVEKLSGQALDQRIPFIMKELATYYGQQLKGETKYPYTQDYEYSAATYADLDEQLRVIQGTHKSFSQIQFRQAEDFYFVFAIRTLLTIKSSKDILRLKRRTVNNFKSGEKDLLVFDYLKGKSSLATGFYLDAAELFGYQLVSGKGIKYSDYSASTHFESDAGKKLFQSLYLDSGNFSSGVDRRFNFTGGVIRWLDPEEDDYKGLDQRAVFIAQEAAALMAANGDVQEVARKAVARAAANPGSGSAKSFPDAVQQGLLLIQKAIANINQGMLEAYKPWKEDETSWRISPRLKACLSAFYTLTAGEKERSKLQRFDAKIPDQYHEQSIANFLKALKDYTAWLTQALQDQGEEPNEKAETALRKLDTFEFKRGEDGMVANGDEFERLLEELYAALDGWIEMDGPT